MSIIKNDKDLYIVLFNTYLKYKNTEDIVTEYSHDIGYFTAIKDVLRYLGVDIPRDDE